MDRSELQSADDLRALGQSFSGRSEDVVERIVSASTAGGLRLHASVDERLRLAGSLSTVAVAGWMAGEGLEKTREDGLEVWSMIGELTAARAVPLTEIVELCLRWRRAAAEVVCECGEEVGAHRDVVRNALNMLQQALDVTLLHVCGCFDALDSAAGANR